MGRFTRDELERAYRHYCEVNDAASRSGDWKVWASKFTEDVHYVEHAYGEFRGREVVGEWIAGVMAPFPLMDFPMDWHVIDEERGWIVFRIWNRMQDPGDGSVHQEANFTLLRYAGDGLFSYQEDIYNPARVGEMIKGYRAHKDKLAQQRDA